MRLPDHLHLPADDVVELGIDHLGTARQELRQA